jgi:phage-related protein
MKSIGSDMAKGQLEGFGSEIESQAAARKIQSYQDALLYQNKAAIKSHSPSKLYRDEIGKNMATGIIVGLEETLNAYDPTTLASGFINKLQSYIFPGLALVASGKGTSLSSMTPVNFGMSQNGSENYMGNISNMPIGMNLPYKSDLQLINQSLQNLTDRMVEQTDSIIAEVGSLRDDVNLVGDRLSHLQVVIDSRTIVGELAPAMNDELLKYGERINRGV